jgi:hypothetical protein
MSAQVSQAEIRKARAYLASHGIPPAKVSPVRLAAAAKEADMGFADTVKFILRLLQGQTNEAAQNAEIVRAAAGIQD